MLQKTCPSCTKSISVFSKGVIKGRFECPHCNERLIAQMKYIPIGIAGAIGGAASFILKMNIGITIAVAIVLAYPFCIQLVKAP